MLTLYYAKNTVALPVRIILNEIGVTHEAKLIEFAKSEQRDPEFLSINPKGRVPVLITEHGALTEAPAILVYLAQAYPEHRLIPDDPFQFARVQELNSYLSSTVHVAHAHLFRGARWADDTSAHESMSKKVPSNLRECAHLIERSYFQGLWVMGENFSISDAYLCFFYVMLKTNKISLDEYPKLKKHHEQMSQRPSVRAITKMDE